MRRTSLLAVAVILALLPGNLAWGQANLPNNANAATVQGPDPTGMLGYPLATVPATGALPWPVNGTVTANSGAPGTDRTSGPTTFNASGTLTINVQGCSSVSVGIKAGAGGWTGRVDFQAVSANSDIENLAVNFPTLSIFQTSVSSTGFAAGQYDRGWAYCGSVNTVTLNVVVTAGSVTVDLQASAGNPFQVQIAPNTGANQLPVFGLYARDTASASWTAPNAQRLLTIDTSASSGLSIGQTYLFTASVPYLYNGTQSNNNRLVIQRTPQIFNTVATAAAGNTALWTPVAGRKFRLMRYMVTVTDQATQAGAGTLTFSLFDGAAGVTGQVHDVFVPALALVNTGALYSSGWIDLGNGYLSTAANNVLNINLSAALTAGTVRVICCGTEE